MLCVADFNAAIDYYRRALGFFVEWVRCEEDGSEIANHWRCKLSLFLMSRPHHGNYGRTCIYCHINDQTSVDDLHADFAANGAQVTESPAPRPWGLYEMRVADLDGNEFRFASSDEEDDDEN